MIVLNNYKKIILPLLLTGGFIILFFFDPSTVTGGVRSGLSQCGEAIIPSLFPFLVLSDYLTRSGIAMKLGGRLNKFSQRLFRLPGCCICVIFMSLIGGYPVGARMAAELYNDGEISRFQTRRLLVFCFGSGPAFTIGTVGLTMLSCRKCGFILYASQLISALSVGVISRFFAKSEQNRAFLTPKKLRTDVIVESVSAATEAMLGMCAWILLFSSLGGFLLRLAGLGKIFEPLLLMSEVTQGCSFAARSLPVFLLAPILSWGGFAVHMQLLPYLKSIGMTLPELWLSRIPCCTVSAIVSRLLFKLFPCEAQVFSTISEFTVKAYSVSVPASVAMLLLGMFTVADIGLATERKI